MPPPSLLIKGLLSVAYTKTIITLKIYLMHTVGMTVAFTVSTSRNLV